MVIRKLTSVWSCLRFFVAIFSFFFSHFWPVVWHLWRFNSALIRPTCNLAVKHQLYIEFEILARDGMNVQLRRVSPSWRARAPAIVLSSYQIEVTLANHFKRLQLTSSAYLKVGMSLIEHRYIATAFGNMLDFGLYTQHRSSCHEAYRAAYFQKIHSLCKHSLSLVQNIICEKEEGNERRSLKIKFSVFALSFGVFCRLPGSRWKPIQSYRCFEF